MEFSQVLSNRVSIRDFKDQAVSVEDLTAIISDAKQAPSWANTQPWKVYIATDDTMKAIQKAHLASAQAGEKGYSDLPTKSRKDWGERSLEHMNAWLEAIGEDDTMAGFTEANQALWNAPSMAYITLPKSAPVWSVYDAGAFANTLMLSAASRGIDSMVAYENVRFPQEIRDYLPISDDEIIVEGIALGYRSNDKINSHTSGRVDTNEILVIK
ncbi:nitroreductase [Streptococcus troglodytae]|uniref:Oxygen-insensitive NAD(P)H nitroreductase n=1 Tax=Streptococcus troglodytae TaxID=1111760 RepID=A0A1L7LJV1_9STRE|nr:nitroreductase [Streptococcus troglodytae]BAQ24471.1 oxygen-insensitive NAD(P)H nitroreductase [Streptococcus troglodytae]